MHCYQYDDLFFASHYISGLKDEIRAVVEPQMPPTVKKASTIAKIQQKVVDRSKLKYQHPTNLNNSTVAYKTEAKPNQPAGTYGRIDSSETIKKQMDYAILVERNLNLVMVKYALRELRHRVII